jgi:hypothetical protein
VKRLLIGLSLMTVACSGSLPTAPSGSSGAGQSVQATADPSGNPAVSEPTVDPVPPVPGANAPAPQFTVSGPRDAMNCFTAGANAMQWILNMTDAGPSALRFIAMASHDDTPGCAAAEKNPRSRVALGGVSDYTPHSSGQTTFTFDPKMYNCGRVQVDVSIFDAAGNEILIVGVVINYGATCAPPTTSLVCQPPAQSPLVDQPVSFTATGGTGAYTWSAPSGSPPSGSGSAFTTSYAGSGTYIATVTSGSATATCEVSVTASVIPQLVCAPPTQTVQSGQAASVTASGGTGAYSWSAPGGSTSTGTGASFNTSYSSSGPHTITVTSGEQTATCLVTVPVIPTLVCAPPTQTVQIGQIASVGATGGSGTYSWSAPGGSTGTGSGASFSTSYAAPGAHTIIVTSGPQTATCQVNVPPPLTNSCAGVTAVINRPLVPYTGTVTLHVPAGQQASIVVESNDRQQEIMEYHYFTVGPGTSEVQLQVACFPKIIVFCGEAVLDAERGVNQCSAQ